MPTLDELQQQKQAIERAIEAEKKRLEIQNARDGGDTVDTLIHALQGIPADTPIVFVNGDGVAFPFEIADFLFYYSALEKTAYLTDEVDSYKHGAIPRSAVKLSEV